MKKIIYTILSITMLTACKKESSNSSTNPTNGTSTAIAKYGNGVTDVEGNKYKTVIIGTQEWMGENLKVSKYSDGSVITNGTDDYVWNNNKLEWLLTIPVGLRRDVYTLQPGNYKLVYRNKNATKAIYTFERDFVITSGGATNVNL